MAETGDTVLVGPGTYPESINFNGRNYGLVSRGAEQTFIRVI